MAYQVRETHADADEKPFMKQYKLFHAAFAQFCYTGAQVAIAAYFINYAAVTRPNTDDAAAANLFAGAQAAFTVGRFIGVFLMKYVKPRIVFLAFMAGCIIFLIPAIALPETLSPRNSPVVMLFMVLFFESICFPTIVGLGMRGLGRHTKRGSGWIVAGVSGGACVPPLAGVANDRHGNGIGMVVPLCFLIAAASYAVAVNFVPDYVKVVDSFGEADIGMEGRNVDPEAKMAEAGLDGPRGSIQEQAAVTPAVAAENAKA